LLMVTIKAPAKINLTLEVLRKRSDGYHEIRSILQTIDLYDTLQIEAGDGISFQCDLPEWSAEKSLASKAVSLIREAAGGTKGAVVRIEKQIPLLSGLGGDSSDAAALLHGLNELWDLKLPPEKLAEMASKLGSDVVFFLQGGTALASGRGEKITPLPPMGKMWVALVVPDVTVATGKTGRMYASLKPSSFTDGAITQNVVADLNQGKPFKPAMLYNVFESVTFEDFNMQRLYFQPMLKMGALHVHLAGSGPTLFSMFTEKDRAEEIYTKCKSQGMKTYLAQTI